jgi:exonuclease SbcD
MKFAHMADCHIGGWNDSKLRELSHRAFEKASKLCIEEKVDFVLISGDLFNTSLPGIESLKVAVENLKLLVDNGINIYVIPGSHDYSPSGKTILDVLEKAELIINIFRFEDGQLRLTTDEKTGAKLMGIIGRRGGLEIGYYEALDKLVHSKEAGFKIFMFHSTLKELVPNTTDMIEHIELSHLPKGFDYYAGGHVHIITSRRFDGYGTVSYPGPLFPNSFSELEELKNGGFCIVEAKDAAEAAAADAKQTALAGSRPNPKYSPTTRYHLTIRYLPIVLSNVLSLSLDCNDKTPEEINAELISLVDKKELINTIITLRLSGELKSGKTTEIDYRSFLRECYDRGAYFVMKNASKLTSKEFREIKAADASIEKIEEMIIDENPGDITVEGWSPEQQKKVIKALMAALDKEKEEGETTTDFENRVRDDAWKEL